MDKKKIIGTIIGVVAFAALIAGATYAWLSFSATITNGTSNFGTMNFSVAYVNGTAITEVPTLESPTAETASSLNVKANKVSGSPDGNLTITLNTTATDLTSGALNYAICVGTCSSAVAADLTQAASGYKGTITGVGAQDIFTTPLTASQTTYNIYFWLDSSLVTGGETYSGYISASAAQTVR